MRPGILKTGGEISKALGTGKVVKSGVWGGDKKTGGGEFCEKHMGPPGQKGRGGAGEAGGMRRVFRIF